LDDAEFKRLVEERKAGKPLTAGLIPSREH
jgi:hypothetical protein